MIYEAVRGRADRNLGVPNALDTKFNRGSMNKMFTAVVVGQLVDEGRLHFEDTLDRWIGGMIYRDTGYVAVVLSNQDGASRPVEARMRSLIGRLQAD